MQFDKFYIIGPTGNQYDDFEYRETISIKDIKKLPRPDDLPKDIKNSIIFDDVIAKEPIINEYFCRGRHENLDMLYLS